MDNTTTRIQALRSTLKAHGLSAYLVPAQDVHQNEYVPECWQRRAWLSNFTGSSGDLLIGLDKCWLWTDSRYFVQAETELDTAIIRLCKLKVPGEPTLTEVLRTFTNQKVGADPSTLGADQARDYSKILSEVDSELVLLNHNLIDELWTNQPKLPCSPIVELSLEFSGETREQKLTQLRQHLLELCPDKPWTFIVSRLDDIAWLLNIRGSDIPYNPLVLAFLILTQNDVTLYVQTNSLASVDVTAWAAAGLKVAAYNDFYTDLQQRVEQSPDQLFFVDYKRSTARITTLLEHAEAAPITQLTSPIPLLRSRKNRIQQLGMREAHHRDAIAMLEFLYWLETIINQEAIDELVIEQKLEFFRSQQRFYQQPSFACIAAHGAHGAIVHYRATPTSNKPIDTTQLLLIDSGAQYLDGTTDLTRTIHLGTPSRTEKQYYTLVLKGHLALARAIFPTGTHGSDLDVLARQFLWQHCLDYGHGTGHGVGSYLCVHEGPQVIALGARSVPLEPGMVISNEPGFYLTGQYGIRIENLELVVTHSNSAANHQQDFLRFETLTLVPYCRKLIDITLLTPVEKHQIDTYHQRIVTTLNGCLRPELQNWMHRTCAPLETGPLAQ